MSTKSCPVGLADSHVMPAGEFIDAFIEAVILPRDRCSRSAVICGLVREMCAAVEWLYGSDLDSDQDIVDELISFRGLAAAAQDHHRRMSVLCGDQQTRGRAIQAPRTAAPV
jgi:hypothetical protein